MEGNDEIRICRNCVGESFLKKKITQAGEISECAYCDDTEEPCIAVEELADMIEGAFERHYARTSDQPDVYEAMLLRDRETEYDWERHGEPVFEAIEAAASIETQVAEDILEILADRHSDFEMAAMGEECEFSPYSYYDWKSAEDHAFAFKFAEIERSLKGQTRFFNKDAEDIFERLFRNIDTLVTADGTPVVSAAGPEADLNTFFRARVFHNSKDLMNALARPHESLGPPPSAIARAGRMNAYGISVFYGAMNPEVALAEVRPPVGSEAVIAEFEVIRPIRLLDVEALHSVFVDGSVFNPDFLDQLSMAKFLARLAKRVTTPVMPDDEPAEYLLTQMIADFLSQRAAPGIDGILFSSVQCPGVAKNVVLFHSASRVAAVPLPAGTEVSANVSLSFDDDDTPDYSVWEVLPKPLSETTATAPPPAYKFDFLAPPIDYAGEDPDIRDSTLRVKLDTITVRHIKGVTFDSKSFKVHRRRIENHDPGY